MYNFRLLKKCNNNIKKINIDCYCEFGYELQLVIPYAYYLHKHNLLGVTNGCSFTNELYYFSENHNEKYNKRQDFANKKLPCPNQTPHKKELDYSRYIPPPYKNIYKNKFFIYEKPLLIIHNKFNMEWNNPPINYIDKETLSIIFDYCKDKYTIIYLKPKSKNIVDDNSNIYNLNEYDLLKKNDIIDGNELYEQSKNKYNISNFNHFQLLIHSNCDRFISVQGGNCVIASYFGGTNIIYAKKGNELLCNSYNGHYKKYSDCNVLHSNNYRDFIKLIKYNY